MFDTFVNLYPNAPIDRICIYYQLLKKWNASHNLVHAQTLEPSVFEQRHLIDCWQLTSFIPDHAYVLDVGSGAGLPGLLLSMAGFRVDLCEIDQSKSAFLKVCRSTLKLDCVIHAVDVSTVSSLYTHTTARAFASLSKLLNVSRETIGVFLKGEHYLDEIQEAQRDYAFSYSEYPSVTDPKSRILITQHVSRETKKETYD